MRWRPRLFSDVLMWKDTFQGTVCVRRHRAESHKCCLLKVLWSAVLSTVDCSSSQSSFVGAMAIADLVKTTLGPKGMVSWSSTGLHWHSPAY